MLDFLGTGLGPDDLSPNGGSRSSFPAEIFTTPLIDLSQVTSDIEIVPAKPGHYPQTGFNRILIEQLSGTQSTPPSVSAGSNAARDNFFLASAAPTNVTVNIGIPAPFIPGSVLTTGTTTARKLVNQPVYLNVITAATGTGGFVLKVRFHVVVVWIAPDRLD